MIQLKLLIGLYYVDITDRIQYKRDLHVELCLSGGKSTETNIIVKETFIDVEKTTIECTTITPPSSNPGVSKKRYVKEGKELS